MNLGNISEEESVCLSSARKVSGGHNRKVVISEVEYRVEELIDESALQCSEEQDDPEIDQELDQILAESDLKSKTSSEGLEKTIERPTVELELMKK